MNKTNNLQIKKGDTIKVISGRDKGKIGEIIQILRTTNQVIVKNVNVKKKHVKPKKEGEVGKISQFEAPINRSNVMLYSTEKQIKQSFSSKEFFTDKSKLKNHSDENKIVLMSIKINNIKQVNGYYVYGDVKQEKTVSVDTSRVDDVNEVIFATLTT